MRSNNVYTFVYYWLSRCIFIGKNFLKYPLVSIVRIWQTQVRTTMENAFWDNIASGLVQEPTDYKRVIDLVGEVREELEALVPESWKDELRECMDLELITQVSLLPLLISF